MDTLIARRQTAIPTKCEVMWTSESMFTIWLQILNVKFNFYGDVHITGFLRHSNMCNITINYCGWERGGGNYKKLYTVMFYWGVFTVCTCVLIYIVCIVASF